MVPYWRAADDHSWCDVVDVLPVVTDTHLGPDAHAHLRLFTTVYTRLPAVCTHAQFASCRLPRFARYPTHAHALHGAVATHPLVARFTCGCAQFPVYLVILDVYPTRYLRPFTRTFLPRILRYTTFGLGFNTHTHYTHRLHTHTHTRARWLELQLVHTHTFGYMTLRSPDWFVTHAHICYLGYMPVTLDCGCADTYTRWLRSTLDRAHTRARTGRYVADYTPVTDWIG